eukprot:Pgem_evm1s1064
MHLFGKAKKAPPANESINKLRETLENLEKRQEYLEKKMEGEVAQAKKYSAAKNKKAALMCLKRKKQYEDQVNKLAGAQMTVNSQLIAIE